MLTDLVRADSEFQSLGAAAEKARAAKTVLTGGRCSRGAVDIVQLLPGATTHGRYACLSEHLFTISCCTFLRGINVNVWTLAIAPLTRVSDQ